MASSGLSSTNQRSKSRGFTVILASVFFEWLLILFLFVDAVISYLLTRFARYCELQTPCLLCSRLDHVLGNEKHQFYWDLICRKHKLELSSLVSCDDHNKLVELCGNGDTINREDKSRGAITSKLEDDGFDHRSHIGYTELKITSDTESDVPLSDDDDQSSTVCETYGKKDVHSKSLQVEPHVIASTGDLISEIPTDPPRYYSESQLVIGSHEGTVVPPTIATDHSLEERTWQQAAPKIEPSSQTGLISADPPSSNTKETASSGEFGQTCASKTGEICKMGSLPMTTREMPIGNCPQKSNSLDLGDAYKLAIGSRGQLPNLLSKQWSGKDFAGVNEDIKLLLSQISGARGIELHMNDISPRLSMNKDDKKSSDASTSIGLQILQKRISLERNESGFESLDGSNVSEIEGESLADRLKRQVEHDRKCLGALYKELDEERNASAVAASQAMAMITRLQQERAALHMEALQYLRLMEEQAEYDMEALQKSNDLLAEKEKEMQDLEEELLFYKEKCPNESDVEKPIDKVGVSSPFIGDTSIGTVNNPLSEFKDERVYILQSLKKLEKKLQLFSNNGAYLDLPNGEYSGNKGDEGNKESGKGGFLTPFRENGLDSLGDEVSNLINRLEALEADQNFIENSINSLRRGDEGLELLQEIVHHLRDLRVWIRSGGLSVT